MNIIELLEEQNYEEAKKWAYAQSDECRKTKIYGSSQFMAELINLYSKLITACSMNDDGETDDFDNFKKQHCVDCYLAINHINTSGELNANA